MRPSFLVTTAATACLALSPSFAHAGYTLHDISGGGVFTQASDINNLGQVVGGGRDASTSTAYYYSAGTGVVGLGATLPAGTTGPISTWAWGINDSGQIAGNWSGGGAGSRGFSATLGGTMVDLGQDMLGGTHIDASGRVLATIDHGGDPANNQLYLYTPGAGGTTITPPGGVYGLAGLRGDGTVIGSQYAYDVLPYPGERASLLQGGAWNDLAIPSTATSSRANGFNEAGVIVGSVETPHVELKTWLTSAGAWVDGRYVDISASSPLHEWSSEATAVNAAGRVIGNGSLSWDGGRFSFVYDLATGTFANLATLLDPASAAGWTDLQLTDINDLGQIVGTGRFGGEQRAFLLAPTPPVPEPATVLMMLCGVVAVARRVTRSDRPRHTGEPR